ncbi:hypothetical protein [Candidatus Magnetaquiglobus chichijimensis]|uniref:hypothetical protein n=1 Tax=Candidatus Magnetaquiglobus chichijimensis TaxID=3141448 RepID=UPI003B96A29C
MAPAKLPASKRRINPPTASSSKGPLQDQVLDPLGKWPALILTVPGHGYRLNDQLLDSSPEAFSEVD